VELFTPEDRDALVGVARAMYPHDGLPDAPYARAIDAVLGEAERDPRLARVVLDGLRAIREGGAISERDALTRYLEAMESSAFFRAVRARVSWRLYDDHEVWAFIGYPGESYSHGGYLHRGFDDLDWLPAVRVAEDPEPLVEIITVADGGLS
jgi:hypothetical protein